MPIELNILLEIKEDVGEIKQYIKNDRAWRESCETKHNEVDRRLRTVENWRGRVCCVWAKSISTLMWAVPVVIAAAGAVYLWV